MATITFGGALKKVFMFLLGRNHPQEESSSQREIDPYVLCQNCGQVMNSLHVEESDFILLHIYQCPDCKAISQYHFNNETGKPIRILHILDNSNISDRSPICEVEDIVTYENFSMDNLWAICGFLCYPALIKSEFTNKTSLIFVKVGNIIGETSVAGYIINSQNVIGEISIIHEDNISHFYNPYLANLPHKDFSYMSSPTPRCEMLESVWYVRFKHDVTGHGGVYMHKLTIIKDIPIKCYGLEIAVRFYRYGDTTTNPTMSKLLEDINIKGLILGENDLSLAEGYSIQSSKVTKMTLTSSGRFSITNEQRLSFYEDIKKFFEKYDIEVSNSERRESSC